VVQPALGHVVEGRGLFQQVVDVGKAAHLRFFEFIVEKQHPLKILAVGHLADQVGGGRGIGGTLLLEVVECDPVRMLAVVGQHDHLGRGLQHRAGRSRQMRRTKSTPRMTWLAVNWAPVPLASSSLIR
jgi:hypothetical protein